MAADPRHVLRVAWLGCDTPGVSQDINATLMDFRTLTLRHTDHATCSYCDTLSVSHSGLRHTRYVAQADCDTSIVPLAAFSMRNAAPKTAKIDT